MYELRTAAAHDADAIAALDARVNPSPWSAESVRDMLRSACGLVALDDDGSIAGFVLFAQAADECEILDIAVDPALHRRRLGARLLAAAIAAAARGGARRCLLEVRESNRVAQAFYSAAGFAEDGRRKDYYRTARGREDALLMSRTIVEGESRCQP